MELWNLLAAGVTFLSDAIHLAAQYPSCDDRNVESAVLHGEHYTQDNYSSLLNWNHSWLQCLFCL